ncbi:sulfotransferase family 2 domain-containing protein [Primorskyibacter sp. 2E107]|uniref:sulfotransferase family 2 domain-containing protein n=1 Tax=Primorskyibacter sp. 2E107 TaxID=3403458 RepID=UPI003AF82F0C
MPIVRIADKLVYFAHVPRAGGTSVERYLSARFGPLAFADSEFLSVPDSLRWTRSSPQHLDRAALSRLFPRGFFDASFAMVRHPHERLRSVFLRNRDIAKTIPENTEFHDWLNTLPLPSYELDNHARPMLDFLPPGTRIFRLEEGMDQVVDWLDDLAGDRDGPRQIGVFNSQKDRLALLGQDPRARMVRLDERLRHQISRLYAADMYWCGYSPTPSGGLLT